MSITPSVLSHFVEGGRRQLTPTHVALAVVIVAGAALRLLWGLPDDGIYWPDEVYQSLEPAHRLVYGYGLVAWEFIEGARNWALPGLLAALMAVARLFGATEPPAYLAFIRGVFVAVAAGTAVGTFLLARVLGATRLAAVAGAAAFSLAAPFVYFGHRAMSETASALPVVLGFVFALRGAQENDRDRWRLWLGASLLGIAVLLRLHNGVFCVALLGILAARRQVRPAGEAFAVLCFWAFVFGLLDKLTWGGWFHSAFQYLQFNLIEGKAAQWGTSPFHWYVRVLFTAMPVVTLLLVVFAAAAWRRAPGVLLACVAFFLLHSYTPHKELRFLIPMMPLVCALAGVGLSWLGERVDPKARTWGALALVVAALFSGLRSPRLTFGELGAYETSKPGASAWGDFQDVNRLLVAAGQLGDLCGIKVETTHQAWTGGYTYLHRQVPYYGHQGPPRHSGRYNYVIAFNGGGSGQVVAREGNQALVRIADSCLPDPHFNWRLP